MNLSDTIFAVSSPAGTEGIRSIVRLSGKQAWGLAACAVSLPEVREAGYFPGLRVVGVGNLPAAAILFQAPKSMTGEDVAELHLLQSEPLVRIVLDTLQREATRLNVPARLAEPGEFSARAFFNGKIDLTEAEGIAATINATQQTELRAAGALRLGDLHRWTEETAEQLADALARIEAGIDFSDEEDVRFISLVELEKVLAALENSIADQLQHAVRIDRLSVPPTVVFLGKPNVGKSSLINALAGKQRSIISPVAGTTRDMLSVSMPTPRGEIRLVDVPGEEAPTDELRKKMMEARENALLDADLMVEVVDSDNAPLPAPRTLQVRNKMDLSPGWHGPMLGVSAKSGLNLEQLREAIIEAVQRPEPTSSARLVLNHRHRAILSETANSLQKALALVREGAAEGHPEILASELRYALDLLGRITGALSPDEVLGRIFAQFCIGK